MADLCCQMLFKQPGTTLHLRNGPASAGYQWSGLTPWLLLQDPEFNHKLSVVYPTGSLTMRVDGLLQTPRQKRTKVWEESGGIYAITFKRRMKLQQCFRERCAPLRCLQQQRRCLKQQIKLAITFPIVINSNSNRVS